MARESSHSGKKGTDHHLGRDRQMTLPPHFRYIEYAHTSHKQDPKRAATSYAKKPQRRHKGMPPHLRDVHRPKRTEPRVVVEDVPCIDVRKLLFHKMFPHQIHPHNTKSTPLKGFDYNFIRYGEVFLMRIEVWHHCSDHQVIGVNWDQRTNYGRTRPRLICPHCGVKCERVYFRFARLRCRVCQGLSYRCCQISSGRRPELRRGRIDFELEHKVGMRQSTRDDLEERKRELPRRRARASKKRFSLRDQMPLNWIL